jgi:malate permease and related proteins
MKNYDLSHTRHHSSGVRRRDRGLHLWPHRQAKHGRRQQGQHGRILSGADLCRAVVEGIRPRGDLLALVSLSIVLISGLVAWPFAKMLHGDPKTFVPPMMFNNCGNMGVPLAVLAAGQQGLSMMVILFTTSNLLHFTLGTWIVRHQVSWHDVLLNPMVVATVAGVAAGLLHPVLPQWIDISLKMIGDIAFPLMLFALGVRLCDVSFEHWEVGLVGAIVCPLTGLLAGALVMWLIPLAPMQQGMVWVFASLPPAVLNFLIADRYHQEPAKVAAIVLIGNLGSVLFVPIGLTLALRQF